MSFAFSCALLLLFLLMPLYVLGCITYLANMFVHKKENFLHLCIEICACTNEPLQAHVNRHICLEKEEMGDMNFLLGGIIFIVMLCIFFFGALCRAFIIFGARCYVRIFL